MISQKSNVRKKASSSKKLKSNSAEKKIALKALSKSYKTQKSKSIQPIINIGKIWDEFNLRYPLEFRLSFIRPDDLLVCAVILENLKLANDTVPRLVRKDPAKPATLIIELPPQGFGEEAFLDATGPEVASTPVSDKDKFSESAKSYSVVAKNVASPAKSHEALPFAKIRMAGNSRIAFAMPADETALDLTAEAVLDACRRWPMQLDVNAAPEPKIPWYERFNDRARFNQDWLFAMTKSSNWSQATDTLAGALGNTRLVRSLNEAAGRIGLRSSQALNAGRTRGLARELKNTLQSEVTKLAKKYPQLKESATRDLALAALTLKSTQAFAASDLQNFDISAIEYLPFLPIIFSPHKPAANVTALELPYRVLLSPVPPSSWWHATQPVEHNGRTELWHTRLTQPSEGVGPDTATNVRALWSADYEISKSNIVANVNGNKPFRMSLDALDRQMLVKLMAGFNEKDADGHTFVPHTARSQRIMLSALGALLDVEGNWNTLPEKVGLEQWRHLATLGRDFYVRVVYRGYLMPFGHSASLIKVTERKFEEDNSKQGRVAILRQRFFIVVREWTKEYSGTGHVYGGRNFPFKSVEVLTRVTPNLCAPDLSKLSDPSNKIYASVPYRACFWPVLNVGQDFVFQLAATDIGGERVTFAMPLLFVGVEANQDKTANKEIITRYNAEPAVRRRSLLGNATICYAPIKDGAEGDPRLPTGTITFDAAGVKGISPSKPQFYPEVESAEVGIAAIQRLLQKPDAVVAVTFPETYKHNGFSGANAGEVFLKTLQAYSLEFGDQVKNDTLGGLATPSMAIQGLSRIMGPAAAKPPADPADIETALSKVINNTFDPADFFKGAKILGGVELSSLLEVAASLVGADVPKLLSKQLPDKIEARFDWKTNINNSDPLGLFVPNAGGSQTVLDMHGVISAPVGNPKASTFNANASLVHFKVNLFGFIIIWFDELAFNSKSGSKPDVAVNMHPGDQAIEFGGPLEFVNKLRQIIPSNGFADPPSLSVTPSGISASYSLNLPSVGVGIFTLEHVSLGAGFSLPFDSRPANVRFNFAERQRPFSLTVSMLGGGGFFAICISTQGVDEIEAALEFGAAVAINLGVASGGVEIKAGVYFHWKSESVELAGYVRLHGELSVLGLISASLTFNLQLAYLKESHHSVLWGEATLTIEIEILFFSFDVSVKCRREFGGSDADPKFIDLIPDQPTWAKYCEAFADEEV